LEEALCNFYESGMESENSNLLATSITFENLLVVATQDYLAREKAKKNAQEGENLDGF
jgi:hypothetical protein